MAFKGEIPFFFRSPFNDKSSDTQVNPEAHENLHPNLKKVVIVRHGHYDEKRGSLDDIGKKQITDLGEKILKTKKEENLSALILSSTALRAMESSEVLSKAIDASIEQHEVLYVDFSPDRRQLQATLELISMKSMCASMLILVTHAPICVKFPVLFGKSALSQEWNEEFVENGKALLIDLKSRNKSHL